MWATKKVSLNFLVGVKIQKLWMIFGSERGVGRFRKISLRGNFENYEKFEKKGVTWIGYFVGYKIVLISFSKIFNIFFNNCNNMNTYSFYKK